MGNVVLKTHSTPQGQFTPDGWYGIPESDDPNRLILPVEDASLIDSFCGHFNLKRGTEPGLSIVVPWYVEDVEAVQVLEAVVRGYFYPILTGALEVTLETPTTTTALRSDSLVPHVEQLGGDIRNEMGSLVALARWAMDRRGNLPRSTMPATPPRWTRDLLPEELAEPLREALNREEPVAVQVRLAVRPKGGTAQDTHFDVFMRSDDESTGDRPTFIREGIIIPDVRAPRTHGVRALVVAEHGPLARLLGDAENPSHTQWQRDGSNFKGKYVYGPQYLGFVTNSVHELAKILSDVDAQEDPSILLDIFSLPAPPDEDDTRKNVKVPRERGKVPPPPPPPPPPPRPRPFRVTRIQGGFSITRGEAEAPVPQILDIRVAYDRRNGNPLKRYDRADFRLDKKPIVLDPPPRGIQSRKRDSNHLVVAVTDPDFSLSVRGFDENRDLYVRVIAREAAHDQEA